MEERRTKIYAIMLNKGNNNGKMHHYQRKIWVKVYTKYLRLLLMKFQKYY